jgi:hypothetical protein
VSDATIGSRVSIDIAPHFADFGRQGRILKYTASNLLPSSGFRIDSVAGRIAGIPTQVLRLLNTPTKPTSPPSLTSLNLMMLLTMLTLLLRPTLGRISLYR